MTHRPITTIASLFAVAAAVCAGLFFVSPVFAGGEPEIPPTEVRVTMPRRFISPNGPDAARTELILTDLADRIVTGGNRVIRAFEFTVFDTAGQVVWRLADQETATRGFFGDLFDVGEVPSVTIPAAITWPGVDVDGALVEDGEYTYQLTVVDDSGGVARSSPLHVTVDTVAPVVESVEPQYTVFSPRPGSARPTIQFTQSTDRAQLWRLEILDANDAVVWQQVQQNDSTNSNADQAAPATVTWNGRANVAGTDPATVLPDGVYRYRITGTDRAANTVVSEPVAFRLNTAAGDIVLSLPAADRQFSPAVRESIRFSLVLSETEGLTNWKMEISNEAGIIVRRYAGTTEVPDFFDYNGRGNPGRPELDMTRQPDGTYRAVFAADYENGTTSVSEPVEFGVDTVAPQAVVAIDTAPSATASGRPMIFGGELKTGLSVRVTADRDVEWIATLRSSTSNMHSEFNLRDAERFGVRFPMVWRGVDFDGNPLPDGEYEFSLRAVDAAGNAGRSNAVRFIKDTRPRTPAAIAISAAILAPGGDRGLDSVNIEPQFPVTDGIDAYLFSLVAEDGLSYFSRSVREFITRVTWTGLRNNNVLAPDGRYAVVMEVSYLNGDTVRVRSDDTILLSRARPRATVSVDTELFMPVGGGAQDFVTFNQTSTPEGRWLGEIRNAAGSVVRRYSWTGEAETFTWDGRSAEGRVLPDGIYSYALTATNAVGNSFSTEVTGIRLDTLSASIAIRPLDEVFSPNGDGFRDDVAFAPTVAAPETVRNWSIVIADETGRYTRRFEGGRSVPPRLVWDGRTDDNLIEDGRYYATFAVEYNNGTAATKRTDTPVTLVKTPPFGVVAVSPLPFSPDDDGFNDQLTIELDASASDRPIATWSVEVFDPMDRPFIEWAGTGTPPANITWDGLSPDGERVQSAEDYSVRFTLADNLRNTHVSNAVVPVDILVMREGDRLRIVVPSIYFAPNTPDLFKEVNQEQLDRNLHTLRRLAAILNRYEDRRIIVEGHATHIFWQPGARNELEEREVLRPLSQARAEAVMNALIILSVDRNRMAPIGYGGSQPVVPHSDLDHRWKNRRVEFLLERR